MDRIIHDTIWIDAGSCHMREKIGTAGMVGFVGSGGPKAPNNQRGSSPRPAVIIVMLASMARPFLWR